LRGIWAETRKAFEAERYSVGGREVDLSADLAAMRDGIRIYLDIYRPASASGPLPVLLAWGEQDAWIPPERTRELAAMVPGPVTCPIEGAGHLVQLDAPAQLTAALTDFLRG
jgi:pimeloyl-ACP methyl ester carboxylesterase